MMSTIEGLVVDIARCMCDETHTRLLREFTPYARDLILFPSDTTAQTSAMKKAQKLLRRRWNLRIFSRLKRMVFPPDYFRVAEA